MRIFIASEFRCTLFNNRYYLAPKAFSIYKRYADAFGDVVLCSRFQEAKTLMEGYKEAKFIKNIVPIDSLLFILLGRYKTMISCAMKNCDLVIARLPSVIACKTIAYAKMQRIPYLTEVMGDAWDGYWNHSLIGKCIAPYMYIKTKQVIWNADYSIYVTDKYLQNKYPCKNNSIGVSNVVIQKVDNVVLTQRIEKIKCFDKKHITLMTSAAVNVHTKGQHFVIKAIKELKVRGIHVTYLLAGGGEQTFLQSVALQENVKNNIVFLGELTVDKIKEYLDITDIYIQPSLQEGLPRAVIEAMSRGCPCIGSQAGGIPELLDVEFIFRKGSSQAIVDAINCILKRDLVHIAKRNFYVAQKYNEDLLNACRNSYFRMIAAKITGEDLSNSEVNK